MEKFIEQPRHIEFQVLADQYGNVVSLGERECSIQRRHQKLLEESPSVAVTPELRAQHGRSTLSETLAAIGYVNAGTVEFLMDEDGSLYFIEMNTRIQVEHPVTEMVTDVDLVKSQIRIAAGGDAGERPARAGRSPAATPSNAASTPSIRRSSRRRRERSPPSISPGGTGVRVDTAAYAEAVVPPYYDSLIAKLIVRGKDRD